MGKLACLDAVVVPPKDAANIEQTNTEERLCPV